MKKRNFCPWFNRIISSVVVKVSIMMFIFIFVSTGCFLIKSMQDIDKTMETTVIVGQVFVESPINGPIIVAAYTANEEKEIAHYTVLHEAGEYELAVDPSLAIRVVIMSLPLLILTAILYMTKANPSGSMAILNWFLFLRLVLFMILI